MTGRVAALVPMSAQRAIERDADRRGISQAEWVRETVLRRLEGQAGNPFLRRAKQ